MISRRSILLAYALLLGLALAPIWMSAAPHLSDYSNHLARAYLLLHTSESPTLRQFYEVHWAVIPNLAMDVVVPALATLFPIEIAGKLFIVSIFLLVTSGTLALHSALHGRASPWPLLAFLFLYNSMFILGLMNYLFGLGLALWGLAAWVRASRGTLGPRRTAPFYVLAPLLFFAHLGAFGFYAIVVLAGEARQAWMRWRAGERMPATRCAWALGQFALPALLFLASPTAAHASAYAWWDPLRKILAPFALVWNYNLALDAATLALLMQLVILGLISRRLVLAAPMGAPLAALGLVFLFMPSTLLTSNYADYRLVPAWACLFVASSDLRDLAPKWGALLVGAVAGLFALRMAVVAQHWRELDKPFAQYMQAIDALPEGARLFAAFAPGRDSAADPGSPHLNENAVPPYAVIRRKAFVPMLYADPRVIPLAFTPAYRALAREAASAPDGSGPDWRSLREHYDYWLIARESRLAAPLPDGLEAVFAGRDFRLYRVVPARSLRSTDAR